MAAIDQKINLIGVPQVTQGLDTVIAKTKQATTAINQVGSQAGAGAASSASPFEALNTGLKSTEAGINATTKASHGLREALHILHPILGELGGSMGELGSFARLASAGLGALAAALGGALLVAIQKAGDEVENLRRKLSIQFGAQGAQQLETIKKAADDTTTSISDVAPAFAAMQAAIQRTSTFRSITAAPGGGFQSFFGLPQDPEKFEKVFTSLVNLLKQGGVSASDAAKQVTEFITAISAFDKTRPDKTVGLTADAFARLQSQGSLLATALQQAFPGNLLDDLIKKNKDFKDVIDKLFQAAPNWNKLAPPDNLATALDGVKHAWEEMLKTLADEGAFGLVTDLLHDFVKTINTTKHEIELLVEAWNAFKKASENLPTPTAEETTQQITGTESPFKLPGQQVTSQQLTDLRLSIDRVKNDFDDLHTSSGQLKAIYDDQGTSMILAGVGMTNLAVSVQKAADASATFAQRFDAVNDALKKSPFVTAPGEGQFGVPPGSKTVGGGLGGGFVSAPGGAGTLTADQLLGSVSGRSHVFTGGGPTQMPNVHDIMEASGVMPHVFDSLLKQAQDAGADAARIYAESFAGADFTDITKGLNQTFDTFKAEQQQAGADAARIYSESFAGSDFTDITQGLNQTFETVGQTAAQTIQNDFADLNFSEVGTDWATAMQGLVSKAQSAFSNIQSIFSQPLPAPSFGSSTFPGGFPLASGGLVRGAGTGTSDSIPAWLSNQEFVLTAASTKFWGEGLLNWMNRAPRFAGGGAVTSQSAVVHLHLGNESFAMNASENVATALRQHAVKSRLVSTGRKPSWY